MSEKNKNENTEQTETEVQTSGNDTEMLQESEKTEDNSKKETKKTESKSKKPLTRKSKKRIASIVISLCVVAAVVLVNIIAEAGGYLDVPDLAGLVHHKFSHLCSFCR